jgi:ABC-2 type transport system permease protein
MRAAWIIAKRELNSFYDSLIAYILLILFLGFSGFFTWPLTMRLLAEERKTGTIELLLTKAVTDREVVVGKFLSTLMLVGIALLFTVPYIITLSSIGNIDTGCC